MIAALLIIIAWIYDVNNHSFVVLGQTSLLVTVTILGAGGFFGFYLCHIIFSAPNKPFKKGNSIIYFFSALSFAVLFSAAFYSSFWHLAGLYVQSRTGDRQEVGNFPIGGVGRNRAGFFITLKGGGNRRGIIVDQDVYRLVSYTLYNDKYKRSLCFRTYNNSFGSFTNVSSTVFGRQPNTMDIRRC